jgi:hypothetical protein
MNDHGIGLLDSSFDRLSINSLSKSVPSNIQNSSFQQQFNNKSRNNNIPPLPPLPSSFGADKNNKRKLVSYI